MNMRIHRTGRKVESTVILNGVTVEAVADGDFRVWLNQKPICHWSGDQWEAPADDAGLRRDIMREVEDATLNSDLPHDVRALASHAVRK